MRTWRTAHDSIGHTVSTLRECQPCSPFTHPSLSRTRTPSTLARCSAPSRARKKPQGPRGPKIGITSLNSDSAAAMAPALLVFCCAAVLLPRAFLARRGGRTLVLVLCRAGRIHGSWILYCTVLYLTRPNFLRRGEATEVGAGAGAISSGGAWLDALYVRYCHRAALRRWLGWLAARLPRELAHLNRCWLEPRSGSAAGRHTPLLLDPLLRMRGW